MTGHELKGEFLGYDFHFTPDNTLLCKYPQNELADHIINTDDEDQSRILPVAAGHAIRGLYDRLRLMEFEEREYDDVEEYVVEVLTNLMYRELHAHGTSEPEE